MRAAFAFATSLVMTLGLSSCPADSSAGSDAGRLPIDAPAVMDVPVVDAAVIDAPGVDGAAADTPGADASGTDAPGTDAPPTDASGADVSVIDAPADDSGLDCALIGCGPPTICGAACDAPCGCCPCSDGDEMSSGGVSYVCAGGCWAPRGTGGDGDPCASRTDCGAGLSCCYPCGIPGCDNVCTPSCSGGPGCFGGCLLLP